MNTKQQKLIADFMEYVVDGEYCDITPQIQDPERPLNMLEFMFKSWDELMPVIDKLQTIWEEPEELDTLKDYVWMGDIERTFNEIVDLIEIHNSPKQ